MPSEPNPALFSDWPSDKRNEIIANWDSRQVGSQIVSETDKLRVWHLVLKPGERAPFHRHSVSYFWTVMGPGKAVSYFHDGAVKETIYSTGDTMHYKIDTLEQNFVHDLTNTGDTTLRFVTVEFKS